MTARQRSARTVLVLISALWICASRPAASEAPPSGPTQEAIVAVTVTARRYAFDPVRIEARQGDVIKITFIAEDIAHTFTSDEYRISKRAVPGQTVTIEFCALDKGRFVFYCSLTSDPECRKMRGELIVR